MANTFMFIGSVLQYSMLLGCDKEMEEEKRKHMIPDDIPIIWVNVV